MNQLFLQTKIRDPRECENATLLSCLLAYPYVPPQAVPALLPGGFVCFPYLTKLVVSRHWVTLLQASSVRMREGRSND